ncbi:30494_t:CDS:1 [Gigaspora margarita]|uniref:30494_t:CDS:1 n=1 Tax=Gigaspora margarita TaxID=4874 RepID=A0ABN7UI90_GIGMA|nr:30494_t:CDS:1 [Gigaspora margarita]
MKKFQGLFFSISKNPIFNNDNKKNIYKLCEIILKDNHIPVKLNINKDEKNSYFKLKKVIEIPNNEEAESIKIFQMKFEIDYIKNYNNPTKNLMQFPFFKNKLEGMSDYPFYQIICLQSADQTINVSTEYEKFRTKIVNKLQFLENTFKIYGARFEKKSDDFDIKSFDHLQKYVIDEISKKKQKIIRQI